jgi:hypothetical protein
MRLEGRVKSEMDERTNVDGRWLVALGRRIDLSGHFVRPFVAFARFRLLPHPERFSLR